MGQHFLHVQLQGKVRESPGFLDSARQALAAYKNQIRIAEDAIQGLLSSQQLQPGMKLSWNARPDVEKAECCPKFCDIVTHIFPVIVC